MRRGVARSQGALDADVIIIGSGIAGALTAYKLATAGLKVIVLEAGPMVTRAELHEKFDRVRVYSPTDLDPKVDYAPTASSNGYLTNIGTAEYGVEMMRAVGGTTWHWTANSQRFSDQEFRLRSSFGVGVDWPITYQAIEPYYVEAEHMIGVTSPSNDSVAHRRSRPTPMQDFVWPYFYKKIRDILAPHGIVVEAGSYARNSEEFDGRPACRGNNTCWPVCPIGAQYAAIFHVEKAKSLGVEIWPQSLATRLEAEAGRISTVVIRKPDGSERRIRAEYFVVAANGVETPKLLLASRTEKMPNGVANASGEVGRNFMDHSTVLTRVLANAPLYTGRGPIAFGRIFSYENGEFRKHEAAASLSIDNRVSVDEIAHSVLKEGYRGADCDKEVRFRATRSFMLLSEVENLPHSRSKITLDWLRRDSAGQPRMVFDFNLQEYTTKAVDRMTKIHHDLATKIGAIRVETDKTSYYGNHPAGATRMGLDPRKSVVDGECRSHDHKNLYIAGSAVFPTLGGAAGPTLTIAALALRTADTIIAHSKAR